MKVGIYLGGFEQESGGGFTFEFNLISKFNELAEQSHHSYVLIFDNIKPNFSLPSKYGQISTISLEKPKAISNLEKFSKRVSRFFGFNQDEKPIPSPIQNAIEQEGLEIIWFPTPTYTPVDIPYISTVWDLQHRVQPWFPEISSLDNWLYRESIFSTQLRRATYIITPNQVGMREISFAYGIPPERFRLLGHPTPIINDLPDKKAVNSVLKKYNLPDKYLLYPAQFWAHKNHANLFLAVKQLQDRYQIDLPIVLVGTDHGNLSYIQELAEKLNIKQITHFLGFVPREDLISLYCGAYALVYLTLFGPENLPPLEAFACGCPVIASKVPGALEQYGDAAFLINPLNVNEIMESIKRILEDKIFRESLISKGFERSQKFTNADYVRGVFDMLDEFEIIRRNWK